MNTGTWCVRLERAVVAVAMIAAACGAPVAAPVYPPMTLYARYVASQITSSGLVTEDSLGRPIRVHADTLFFTLADTTFVQVTNYGAYTTGSEVITTRRSLPRRYTRTSHPLTAEFSLDSLILPGLLGGVGKGVLYSTGINMTVRTASTGAGWYWAYVHQ